MLLDEQVRLDGMFLMHANSSGHQVPTLLAALHGLYPCHTTLYCFFTAML